MASQPHDHNTAATAFARLVDAAGAFRTAEIDEAKPEDLERARRALHDAAERWALDRPPRRWSGG